MPTTAAAILWTEGSSPWAFRPALIADICKSAAAKSVPLHCRVKAGAILPAVSTFSNRAYSEWDGTRRSETRSRIVTPDLAEQTAKRWVTAGIHTADEYPPITADEIFGVSYECAVFSAVPLPILRESVANCQLDAHVRAIAEIDFENRACFHTFWNSLVLRHIIIEQVVLESVPDSPDDFGFSGKYLNDEAPAYLAASTDTYGYFAEELPPFVIVQVRHADLPLPPDIPKPALIDHPPAGDSPAQQFMNRLPFEIRKISRLDQPGATSEFAIDDSRWEWPDPSQVERKIRGYCLNRDQVEQKWKGFAHLEFAGDREEDVVYLTYAFCSALVRSQIQPYDFRVAADGTGEFVVYIALPCPNGQFRTVLTGWNIQAGKAVALSTAYVSKATDKVHSLPLQPPASIASDTASWESRFTWVLNSAAKYAALQLNDPRQAYGWLWIRHDDERSKKFARWCRQSRGSTTFKRKELGGQCTQLTLGLGLSNVSQVVASLRMAEICLGIIGVRSVVEVEWD